MSTEREKLPTLEQLRLRFRRWPARTSLVMTVHEADEIYRAIDAHLAREKAEPVAYYSREYCRYYDAADIASTLLNQDLISKGELIPLYTHQTAPTTQPSEVHGLKITDDLADYLWWVLDHYANASTYHGKRIGGVLQGCPRGPEPTADDLTLEASLAKKRLKAAYEATHSTAPAEAYEALLRADIRRCLDHVATEFRARGRDDNRFVQLITRMDAVWPKAARS